MKKLMFVFVVLSISLIGCITASNTINLNVDIPEVSDVPTKFEGAWRNPYSPFNSTYTFKGNQWIFTDNTSALSGLFVFNDTDIIFITSDNKRWGQKYEFIDNIYINLLREGTVGYSQTHVIGPFYLEN